jgi:hypothetical protein
METPGRKYRALLFAVVLMIVPPEIICRVATATFLKEYTPTAIRETMGDLGAPESVESKGQLAKDSIHPYLGFVVTPGLGLDEKDYPVTAGRLVRQVGPDVSPWWLDLRANNWGFWSPHPMPYEGEPNDYVVAVVGGSVAMWLGLQGAETLERELERGLPGRDVVVLNFGLGGFKQPQQAMLLNHLLSQGVKLDAVVNIDGFNEAAIGYQNVNSGTAPDYPRADLWSVLVTGIEHSNRVLELQAAVFSEKQRAARQARRAVRWSRYSNILGIVFTTRARAAQVDEQVLQADLHRAIAEDLPVYREFAALGPKADRSAARSDEQIVRLWVEGSVNLAALCARRGIAYLHVLQPTLHDTQPRPSKPLSPAERRIEANRAGSWGLWREGVRRFYPKFREQAATLQEAGVVFADLSGLFESTPGPIYYDVCHYNQQGNEMLAREIAALLQSSTRP